METLMYNSTKFLRLTLSQYGKAFDLPHFIVINWIAFFILFYTLVIFVYSLAYITF